MNSNHSKNVIIWAVDPFSDEWKSQRAAAQAIQGLTEGSDVVIQPVYAATNPLTNLPGGFSVEVFEGVREKAQDRFDEMIEGLKMKPVAPIKILQIEGVSVNRAAANLLAYAKETGAQTIVIGTRAKKGAPHWFFGSFAESISLRSDIPLLVVNPSWKAPRSAKGKKVTKSILFPTDFSSASHDVFSDVIQFAKASGSELCIFNKYFHITAPVWNSPLEAKLSYGAIYEDGLRDAKKTMQQWEAEAREQGVNVTSEIDSGKGDSAADSILEKARSGSSIIAMAAESGSIEATFLGSVTRRVIREAQCPVWVLRARRSGQTSSVDDSRLTQYKDQSIATFPKVV